MLNQNFHDSVNKIMSDIDEELLRTKLFCDADTSPIVLKILKSSLNYVE